MNRFLTIQLLYTFLSNWMTTSPFLSIKPPCTLDRWSLHYRTKADALMFYILLPIDIQSIFHDPVLPSGGSCNYSLTEEIQHKLLKVYRPHRATAEMDLAAHYYSFLFSHIMLATKLMTKAQANMHLDCKNTFQLRIPFGSSQKPS